MPINTIFDPRELLGQKIGDYELREVLGTGNSAVYRAYDPGKNELVALKLVRWPGANVDSATLKRFKREIELLRKRRHPHIIDIYDWRTSGDYVFLVMEACDGTLADWLKHHRPKLSEALAILEPLAEAIDFLHVGPESVLHRDVKPQNILFKGDTWYISDFSIARGQADQNITLSGQALGTLRYAAPEQIMGAKLGPATDIYSFGLVVFEVLAGGWVFAERDADWSYVIPDISRYNPQLSRDVTSLFKRWLSPDPTQRPKRAVGAIRELAALAGILRDPNLARLYDLASELAGQPRDVDSWNDALAMLDVIRGHEPQFTDPRGIEAAVRRRLEGMEPGPAPAGYTGRPTEFYSEATVEAARSTAPLALQHATDTPKILRPSASPREDFVPRSRYDCDAELHVPAEVGVGGSIFGRAIVVEETALVAGDCYSLGDVIIGAGAEIGGIVVAGGTVTLGQGARVNGPAGVQAAVLRIEPGGRVEGWASSLREASIGSAADVEGVLAGGPLKLAEESRSFSPSAGSAGGDVDLEPGALLADMPVGPENLHPWTIVPSGDGMLGGKGYIASALLDSGLHALTRDALQDTGPPLDMPAPSFPISAQAPPAEKPPGDQSTAELEDRAEPQQVAAPVLSSPVLIEVAAAGDAPALYRESAIRVGGDNGPEELPPEPERALAAAWMLDRAWIDYARRLRLPAAALTAAVLAVLGLSIWIASPLPILLWLVLLGAGIAISWHLRPRAIAIAKVYWAWQSFGGGDGAFVWDTRRAAGQAGYPELLSDPGRLIPLADAIGGTRDDLSLLGTLRDLTAQVAGWSWHAWPGLFEVADENDPSRGAPAALRRLGLQRGLPSEISRLQVLLPALPPEQVRACAARLRGWPADGARQRRAVVEIAARLKAANSQLALWNAAREESQRRITALKKAWEVQQSRAAEIAERTFGLLEEEVGPDATRTWAQHEASATLVGDHFAARREELGRQFAAEQAAAEQEVKRAQAELDKQEAALQKIDAEIEPLPRRWREEAARHDQARAALQEQWDRARANIARQEGQGVDPFVRPRAMDMRNATQQIAQLGDAAPPLEKRLEELQADVTAADRGIGTSLPWPQWPGAIEDRADAGVIAREINAFARKLRSEAASLRTRLESAGSLRGAAEYALEGALGALEAVDQALAGQEQREDAIGDPEISRLRNLRARADGTARALRKVLNQAHRLQRRLQAAEAAYGEFAETLAAAVKEGRAGRPWEEARQIRADHERLTLARETALAVRDEARARLERGRTERAVKASEEAKEMQRLAGLEQTLVRRSHQAATRDERQLRRHIDDLRQRHEQVIAALRRRDSWPDALGRFEAGCFDARVNALEHLRGRIGILCDQAISRLAQTEQRRAAALWPDDEWPGGEMRYLIPVWLLQYRPGGSRTRERLLALTPAEMAPVAGRFALRPASGFDLVEEEALSALFAAEVVAPTADRSLARIPGHLDLADPRQRQLLLNAWEALAADKWLPGWIKHAL